LTSLEIQEDGKRNKEEPIPQPFPKEKGADRFMVVMVLQRERLAQG